jgi:multidrug resistance protein
LGIIIPILPFYVESFGVSSFVVTLLFSVFALCAFVSAPFLGSLSDRIGRRPVMLISIASTAIGWFVFASAHSIWILFLGRIIDGMAAGNFPTAQSYLVDIARSDKERTTNLGLIGAVFGIGFILGPAIGATLSGVSPNFPFWVVGALAACNLVGAAFFLPETHRHLDASKKTRLNPLLPIRQAMKDKLLLPRYVAWLFFGMAFAGMQATFALFVKAAFGFSAIATGYIFMGMGIVIAVNQAFMLKNFWLKRFKEADLEIWLFLVMMLGFLALDLKIFFVFAIGIFLITLGQSTLRVVMSSGAAGIAGNVRRGEVLGIMASVMSISMIIGPVLSGLLFEKNIHLPFLFDAACILGAFFIMKNCCGNGKIKEPLDLEMMG